VHISRLYSLLPVHSSSLWLYERTGRPVGWQGYDCLYHLVVDPGQAMDRQRPAFPQTPLLYLLPLFVPQAKVGYNRDRSVNRSGIPFKPASSIQE
jgi:hypothetical protein